jgi:hypothetical protein
MKARHCAKEGILHPAGGGIGAADGYGTGKTN